MKENFMDTCACVNFCTRALFLLSPICSGNIRHGMGGGKPRKRLGRVTIASTDLQNYFFSQRFSIINTVRRVAFVLPFHLLSTFQTLFPIL